MHIERFMQPARSSDIPGPLQSGNRWIRALHANHRTSTIRGLTLLLWILSTLLLRAQDSPKYANSHTGSVITAQSDQGQLISGEYIVVLKPGSHPAEVARAHALERHQTYSYALNGFAGPVPEGRLRALQNDPHVEWVERDQQIFPFAQTVNAGIRRIGADRSAVAKIDGLDERVNVDVAIIDSGIDLSHPDLNVFRSVSLINDGSNGNDGHGHGTYAAGIVGALDNDFGVVGVAPGARLWAVKVIDNNGAGSVSTLLSGVDYVTQNAASIEVANISVGFVGTSAALRTAIQNSVASGVVYVAAAGNGPRDVYGADKTFGTADDTIPAAYPEVITVSAMNDNDGISGGLGGAYWDDCFAFYSNFGSKVDLAAPGASTYSTALMSKGGYGSQFIGTSMAAPHVSGAVALYIAANGRATTTAGVAAIKQALVSIGEPQSAWGPTNTYDPDSVHEVLVNAAGTSVSPPLRLTRIITHSRINTNEVILRWEGGKVPYQVQKRTSLTLPWEDVGQPTTATSVTNTFTDQRAFFRVRGAN